MNRFNLFIKNGDKHDKRVQTKVEDGNRYRKATINGWYIVMGNVSGICAVGSDNDLTEALPGRKPVVEGCDNNELS